MRWDIVSSTYGTLCPNAANTTRVFRQIGFGSQFALRQPHGVKMKTFLSITVFLTTALTAMADSKIAPDLPQSNSSAVIDVIVQYKTPATKDELQLLGAYGQIKEIYNVISGVNETLPFSMIQQIQSDPNVAYVTPNRTA